MSTKDKLYEKFDVRNRRGRGGNYNYVAWQDVADRMNEVFGVRWSSKVTFQDVIDDNVIVRVKVAVKDPDTAEWVFQEGFGGAPNDKRQEAGNPFKSAYSKALKDACKKWGVGLYLEDDESHSGSSAPPSGFVGQEYGVPSGGAPTAPPTAPTAPPVPSSTAGNPVPPSTTISAPPVPEARPMGPAKIETPSPVLEQTAGNGYAPPPMPPAGTVPTVPTVPKVPTTPEAAAVPSPAPTVEQDDPNRPMTDVQKAAIVSVLNIPGVTEADLIKEAFESAGIPTDSCPTSTDDLNHWQALMVVKYGNEKHRKR